MPPFHLTFYCALFSLLVPDAVAVTLTSTGGTLTLNDIPYYVPGTPYTTVSTRAFQGLQSVNGLVPVTVVNLAAGNDSLSSLESVLGKFAADDVWNAGFLEGKCFHVCRSTRKHSSLPQCRC